LNKTNIEPTVF